MDHSSGSVVDGKRVVFAFCLFFGFVFCIQLCRQPIVDWDEKVYLHLSKNMTWTLQHYNTRNSCIERNLPQGVYHSPVFHHPPVIPYAIKILSFAGSHAGAKLLNLALWLASLYLIFFIARRFSNDYGALLALGLWVVCPIVNLEASLVHLDFPTTVFMLAGFWYFLRHTETYPEYRFLALSGLAFSLSMLTKYTGPLLVITPLLLFVTDTGLRRDKKAWVVFGGIVTTGFAWWFYIIIKFGNIIPPEFSPGVDTTSLTPYLKSLSHRKWYDVWIYFAAICPLFFLYLAGGIKMLWNIFKEGKKFLSRSSSTKRLLVANASLIIFVFTFSIINGETNGYWVFRHIMRYFHLFTFQSVFFSANYLSAAILF